MSSVKIEFTGVDYREEALPLKDGLPIVAKNGLAAGRTAVVTKTTAAAVTYTAAEFVSGLILRDPNGGARTDVTPSAVDLVQVLGAEVGNGYRVVIRNTADAAETITMSGGTRVTISGVATIAQNNTKEFLLVCTNNTPGEEAFTAYSLGTRVT